VNSFSLRSTAVQFSGYFVQGHGSGWSKIGHHDCHDPLPGTPKLQFKTPILEPPPLPISFFCITLRPGAERSRTTLRMLLYSLWYMTLGRCRLTVSSFLACPPRGHARKVGVLVSRRIAQCDVGRAVGKNCQPSNKVAEC